jgi:hypothetical protein
MKLIPSWEAASCATTQELPNILWNPKFIIVFTRTLHWSLSLARWIQSIPPHPIPLRSILTLFTYLCLLSGLFPSGFPNNILYAFPFSPNRATCPAHIILIDFIILIILGKEFAAPQYAVFSSLLSFHLSLVQILSSAPCSQTPSVCVPPLLNLFIISKIWNFF